MKEILKKVLTGTVAIPYSDDIIEALDTVCAYSKELDCFAYMEEMSECFLFGIVPIDFENHLKKALTEQGIKVLPLNVVRMLALYQCCRVVKEEDDELCQSIMATIFMNYMLAKKGSFTDIPHPDIIAGIYSYHISKYLAKTDNVQINQPTPLVDDIAENKDNLTAILEENENREQLRIIAKLSACHRRYLTLNDKERWTSKSPFLRAYEAIKALIAQMDYLYYDFGVEDIMNTIFTPDELKTRKKIDNILLELQGYEKKSDGVHTNSFLLQRLLDGEEDEMLSSTKSLMLSVREFIVYAYYECLTEAIIAKTDQ